MQAYFHSAATLNYVRAMILGGVADLHHPRSWMLESIKDSHVKKEYETLIDRLCDSINFLNAINSGSSFSSHIIF